MKKLFILATLILTITPCAYADDWKLIEQNETVRNEVNVTSMYKKDQVVYFWRKSAADKHNIIEVTYHYESVDCDNNMYATHESDTYIRKQLIHTDNMLYEGPIEKGTIKEKVADFVCSYSNF